MSHLRKYEKRYESSGPVNTPGSVYDKHGKTFLSNAHNVDTDLMDRTASVSFNTSAATREGNVDDKYLIKISAGLQYVGTLREIHGPLGDGVTYRWWFDNVSIDHTKFTPH
jgi:hypothetical protein